MAVSPFDGASRIRFKGSLVIADCQFPIADLEAVVQSAIGNCKSAMFQTLSLSHHDFGSPETYLVFKTVETILGLPG